MGYGVYGIVQYVGFNPVELAWLERGGVMATAHVRGGGEYGEDWHQAGYKTTKPNTSKDFIAGAEYLIAKKYTSPRTSRWTRRKRRRHFDWQSNHRKTGTLRGGDHQCRLERYASL